MSETSNKTNITRLLVAWQEGNTDALNDLMPLVYNECRRLAQYILTNEERDVLTLQATAMVHEAFLRLAGQKKMDWKNRAHFLNLLAMYMRRVLVDYSRKKKAEKRGSSFQRIQLEELEDFPSRKGIDLLELDHALESLAKFDKKKVKLVEMKYFAGLTIQEIAEVLNMSQATVKREWVMTKAWLHSFMVKKTNDRGG